MRRRTKSLSSHSALRCEQLEVPIVRARHQQLGVRGQVDRHGLAPVGLQGQQQLPIVRAPQLDQAVVTRAGKVQPWAIAPFLRKRLLLLFGRHRQMGRGATVPALVLAHLVADGLFFGFFGGDAVDLGGSVAGFVLALDDVRGDGPVGTEETDVGHVVEVRWDGIQRLQRAHVPYPDGII